MQYVFIAATIVMIVLNLFMLAVVGRMGSSVGKQIRKETARLFSVYDKVLKKKSNNIKTYEVDKEDISDELLTHNIYSSQTPEVSLRISAPTKYKDIQFLEQYRAIKEKFSFDKKPFIVDAMNNRKEGSGRVAQRLLQTLSFDSVYKLSTLDRKIQLEILTDILDDDQLKILSRYTEKSEKFDVVEFYQTVQQIADTESGYVHILRGSSIEEYSSISPDIITHDDDTVCEGIQIIVDNKLYDYSIRKGEIT